MMHFACVPNGTSKRTIKLLTQVLLFYGEYIFLL